MRLNRLDLNLLVALDTLLSERNITAAAKKLNLSQPAASAALSRLRQFFNDELLIRVGAKMQPTVLGESLAEPVHEILLQIQITIERGIDFAPESCERTFRFNVGDYSTTVFMGKVANQIASLAPGIQMEFFVPTHPPSGELEKGKVDFLIMPESILHPEHPFTALFQEEFVCIAASDNDEVHNDLTVDEFMGLGHVGVRFGANRSYSQDLLALKSEFGLEPKLEITTSAFNAIPQFLTGTKRIATVYRHLAEHWQSYMPIKIVPLPVALPKVNWALQWHQFREHDPGVKWVTKQIVDVATRHFQN